MIIRTIRARGQVQDFAAEPDASALRLIEPISAAER